jgi:hypothetical protein
MAAAKDSVRLLHGDCNDRPARDWRRFYGCGQVPPHILQTGHPPERAAQESIYVLHRLSRQRPAVRTAALG